MAIHIHIYDGTHQRRETIAQRGDRSLAEKRARQREEDARRSRAITDRGGIDCTMRPSDVIR